MAIHPGMMSQQVDQIMEEPIWFQCVDLKTDKLMLLKLNVVRVLSHLILS